MNKIFYYFNIFIIFCLILFSIINLNLYFNPIDQLSYYLYIIIFIYLITLILSKKFIYIPFLIFLFFLSTFKFYNNNLDEDINYNLNKNILKTVTFNLNLKNNDFDSIYFFNKNLNKDIYCFQEVSNVNYKKIKNKLKQYFYSHKIDEVNKWSSLIFSKYKLFDTKIYNNHTTSLININNFKILIICSHFNIFDSETLNLINSIITKRDPNNILILGDFNSAPYSNHFKKFTNLINLKTYYSPIKPYNTWPSFLPNYLRIQIDNVLFKGNFKITNISIGKNYKSDHLPLYVDLEY